MPFPEKVPRSQFTQRIPKKWGQLYWFDFREPTSGQHTFAEPHPALIISDHGIRLPGTVLIIPFTGAEHKRSGYEFHVEVSKAEYPKLEKDSIAKVDQIYCVEERLMPDQYFIGDMPLSAIKRIYGKLLKVLGYPKVIG